MLDPASGRPDNVLPGPGRRPATQEARAYCGAAHGSQWTVTDAEPPAWVELPHGAATVLYRLVRHPRSARPTRDRLGALVYVPMTDEGPVPAPDEHDHAPVAAVVSLHARSRRGPEPLPPPVPVDVDP